MQLFSTDCFFSRTEKEKPLNDGSNLIGMDRFLQELGARNDQLRCYLMTLQGKKAFIAEGTEKLKVLGRGHA